MLNYNTQLQSNNADLQQVLQTLQSKAVGIVPSGTLTITKNGIHDVKNYAFAAVGVTGNEEDAIVSGTIMSYTNDRVTKLRPFALCGAEFLQEVYFPACSEMTSFTYNITGIAGVTGTTWVSGHQFAYCKYLISATLPKCETIAYNAFAYCTSLTTVSFPACTTIGSSAFDYCTSLTTVSFPACTNISSYAFADCTSLTTASFPVCTTINYGAFNGCCSLSSLTLGASSVCTLLASHAFYSTPYAGYSSCFSGTPYIYVPSSLVASYQSATNWTYFSSYFSSIESLEGQLISFTIDGTEYQAEVGMTWAEWVDSEYNIDTYRYNESSVFNANGMSIMDESSNSVVPSDNIVADTVYIFGIPKD